MSKEDNFKEKFKLALLSTANALADDYSPNNDKKNKKKSRPRKCQILICLERIPEISLKVVRRRRI